MSLGQALLVVLAGLCAGTINTLVGSGTLLTFPILLAIGLPPVTANVSNTLGLLPGTLSGAFGYRRELAAQRPRILVLGSASLLGGITGAVLLLALPSQTFEAVIPYLIFGAVGLVIVQPLLSRALARRTQERAAARADRAHDITILLWILVLLAGIYGGYFGAAQGVILLAIMGALLVDDMQNINGLKNVLAAIVNGIAAIIFVSSTHIDWLAAGLLAIGSVVGGLVGAHTGRRLSPAVFRGLIVVVGLVAAVKILV